MLSAVCFGLVFLCGVLPRVLYSDVVRRSRNCFEKSFPMSGLLFLGSLFGINSRERIFAFCCLFWSCVFLWCFA